MQAHPNARMAAQASDAPDERHGTEEAPEVLEARREIGDLDAAARAVVLARDEDGRVLEEGLLAARVIDDIHSEDAGSRIARGPAQQRAEHRIAVEAREAAPRHGALGVDEAADGAIPDEREIERVHCAAAVACPRAEPRAGIG